MFLVTRQSSQGIATMVCNEYGQSASVGDWSSRNENEKVLLRIGRGHYTPWHMDEI